MSNTLRKLLVGVSIALVAMLMLPSLSNAQSFYGSIVGTVTDNTAAVVPNAAVTLTNLGTNEKRVATTDASGNYRFVNLVPAIYKVDIESANFKHFTRNPVPVTVDSTFRVDAALQVGATSETVEVTTAAPLLQTESGTLGDTVEGKQVQEMPLNGRNTLNLIALVPGVVPQGGTGGSAAMNSTQGTSSASWGNYQIGGGMPLQSSMYIDGAPISILNKNFTALVPSPDLIQEFKVESSGVSAEFGRFGGGVVNMTTKSGTNSFHFSAYEFIRNKVLNANYFFTKRAGQARTNFTQNQFGFVASGPVIKDKLFLFGTWEAIHVRATTPYSTNVPTADMQNGIFSTAITGLNGCVIDTATNPGKWTIPTGCIDASAKVFQTMYAKPNATGTNNYYLSLPRTNDTTQWTIRGDYKLSANQSIFARYTHWPLIDGASNPMQNANGWHTAGSQTHNRTYQAVLGDTITINPTTLLDIRLDYMRQYGDAVPPDYLTADLSKFGPSYAALKSSLARPNNPMLSFGTGTQLHSLYSFSYNNITLTYYNNYHLSAGLTKILNKHTIKAGVEGRLQQRDDLGNNQAAAPVMAFSTTLAKDEYASMLMGYFDQATLTTIKPTTTFNKYYAFYVTDTWQATRKLTLNLGLRLDLTGAPAENKDSATALLPTTTDPNTGIVGTVGLVNSALYAKRTTLTPVHNAFGPRFGFAYRLNDSTVIRGGYSLTYLPNDAQTGAWANGAVINSASTINKNTATSLTYKLSNPFPTGFTTASGRADSAFMTRYVGQTVAAPYPDQPYPRAQSMNVSIGHQFKGNLMLDIGGTHALGIHLASISQGLDQLPSQYFSQGAALIATKDPSNNTVNIKTPNGVALPSALQIYGQSLRPYPYYNNYSNSTDYHGTSSYNALEVKLVKRFKAAGQIGGAYTWMKMISDTDTILTSQEVKSGGAGGNGEGLYQDFNNKKGERSIYSYNVPNRLVINYVLNLPFGKGQHFFNGVHGVTDKIVSGWAVNGIITFQNGYPLYLTMSQNNLSKYFGAGTIRPNYTAGCSKKTSVSRYDATLATSASSADQRAFNSAYVGSVSTGCFASPGLYAFGNEPRVDGTLKSDGTKNFDFTMVKNTTIHDKLSASFRVEFFNIFNRTQFAPPVSQIDNANVGLVLSQANQPRIIQGALRISF